MPSIVPVMSTDVPMSSVKREMSQFIDLAGCVNRCARERWEAGGALIPSIWPVVSTDVQVSGGKPEVL